MKEIFYDEVDSFKYEMRSARSFGFFSPGNTILVPGMYCTKTFLQNQYNKITKSPEKRKKIFHSCYKKKKVKKKEMKATRK